MCLARVSLISRCLGSGCATRGFGFTGRCYPNGHNVGSPWLYFTDRRSPRKTQMLVWASRNSAGP